MVTKRKEIYIDIIMIINWEYNSYAMNIVIFKKYHLS